MKKTKLIILIICLLFVNKIIAQDNMPSKTERIYSLSIMWKELQYSFAFPETFQQVNLDSLYLAYLPKVESVKNNYEYYNILCEFMAHFNEAHTGISTPRRPDDLPPLKTITFGEKIIVSNVAKNMLDQIPLGSEILKINHIPVIEYLKDSIYQYVSASTSHWKFDKAVVDKMLYGKPLSTVNLTVKTPKGKENEVSMIRNFNFNSANEIMADTTKTKPINIRIINKNIGYIQLNSFLGTHLNTIHDTFNHYLPQLRKCKGLIIDIRGNRGGTDEAWEHIAYFLISESQIQTKGKWFSRKSVTTYSMWGEYDYRFKEYYHGTAMEEIQHSPYMNTLEDSLKLHQPLFIISGQHVGSAAEDFLVHMKDMKRATVIGEPSTGAIGEPMFISLPGKYVARICAKKYVNSDGTQPIETGILPDIEVKRDYNAYLKGKDNILEQAISELQKQIRD